MQDEFYDRAPRNRCHLVLTLEPEDIPRPELDKYSLKLGVDLDYYGVGIAASPFVEEWETDIVLRDFLKEVGEEKWSLLDDLTTKYKGKLELSVEIWFDSSPALIIGQELLDMAHKHHVTFDIDLYAVHRDPSTVWPGHTGDG